MKKQLGKGSFAKKFYSILLLMSMSPGLEAKHSSKSCPDGIEVTADYVIVGAGAGGCVVASRLAQAGHSVIVLEAGPDTSLESHDILVQLDKILIDIPINFINLYNRFNQAENILGNCGSWNATQSLLSFVSTDQNGVYYAYPRGCGAGGSVSHHAMQDGIGSLQVYDNIAQVVEDPYWLGSNMNRLFKKMERVLFANPGGECGTDGWISVQHSPVEAPFFTDVVDSIVNTINVPFRENFCNPQDVAGVGNASVQVNADSSRCYAYQDLLLPTMNETGNIRVFFNTLAAEIILEEKKGRSCNKYKAAGVKAYDKSYLQQVQTGAAFTIVGTDPNDCTAITTDQSLPVTFTKYIARKEVIVSAGAIQTPQLLMLSGIGPKDHLKTVGILPKVDLPGVGSDLLDHCEMGTIFELDPLKFIPSWQAHFLLANPGIVDNPAILEKCLEVVNTYPQFLNTNTGSIQWDWYSAGQAPIPQPGRYPFPDTHTVPYAAFVFNFDQTLISPNDPGLYFNFYHNNQIPDINDPFNQTGVSEKADLYFGQFAVGAGLNPRVFVTFLTENLLPHITKGTVRLASNDPRNAPIIREELYLDDEGLGQMADMVLQVRNVMAPLADYGIAGQPFEIIPGPNVVTREDIIEYIKLWSSFGHHISGTCQMGAVDHKTGTAKNPNTVLDSRCRVRGVDNLRVADTSVYVTPWLHAFNPSRGAYVVGEAVSEFIVNKLD